MLLNRDWILYSRPDRKKKRSIIPSTIGNQNKKVSIKSDEIEPRLEEFKKDYDGFKNRTQPFKVYK